MREDLWLSHFVEITTVLPSNAPKNAFHWTQSYYYLCIHILYGRLIVHTLTASFPVNVQPATEKTGVGVLHHLPSFVSGGVVLVNRVSVATISFQSALNISGLWPQRIGGWL